MLGIAQTIMAGWMFTVLAVLTIVVIDIAAERLRERRKRIEFRNLEREFDMRRHPASRCFVSGERR
jgi:hypothetical protein